MIITVDKYNNIKIGDFVIKDKEELKKCRDFLMNESFEGDKLPTYRVLSDIDRITSVDFFKAGSFAKDDNLVIHEELNCDSDVGLCSYNEKVISSYFLNSILIFTSLLGEINKSSVSPIAQQFIENGIFRYDSFENIWKDCSKNLLKRKSKYDLIAFRAALEEPSPMISYEISRVISGDESRHAGFFRGLDFNALNQIKYNSKILLGDNSIFEKDKQKSLKL